MSILEYPSASPADSQHARGRWFLWAIYLAMSWTWCIGMFLPVLLVRDFGIWGWVVFAIPNVIGAAAVGWINRSVEQSVQTVAAHQPAMNVFSWVTATFQIFFAFWIFSHLSSNPIGWTGWMIAISLIGVSIPAGRYKDGGLVASTIVFLVSIAAISLIAARYSLQLLRPPTELLKLARYHETTRLAELFALTSFGFLLCPHLDMTFHRARERLSRTQSQLAFGFGFGFIFLGMIVFSICYAGPIRGAMGMGFQGFQRGGSSIFLIYLLIQLAFTVGVHWQQGQLLRGKEQWLRFGAIALITTALGVLIGWMSPLIKLTPLSKREAAFLTMFNQPFFDGGELVYRLFLSFYGLIFPAYVWICMLPGRWIQPPNLRQWIVLAIAVIVAAPMFWMCFIERQMIWVVPGLTVPLAARFFVRSPVQQ